MTNQAKRWGDRKMDPGMVGGAHGRCWQTWGAKWSPKEMLKFGEKVERNFRSLATEKLTKGSRVFSKRRPYFDDIKPCYQSMNPATSSFQNSNLITWHFCLKTLQRFLISYRIKSNPLTTRYKAFQNLTLSTFPSCFGFQFVLQTPHAACIYFLPHPSNRLSPLCLTNFWECFPSMCADQAPLSLRSHLQRSLPWLSNTKKAPPFHPLFPSFSFYLLA